MSTSTDTQGWQHVRTAGAYSTYVQEIGDVTVTLDLPVDCPVPYVDLVVHVSRTSIDERKCARRAFGLDDEHVVTYNGHRWHEREQEALQVVVHGDDRTDVAA